MKRKEFLAGAVGSFVEEPQTSASKKKTVNEFANKTLPAVQRTTSGIEPYTGVWGNDQVLHLLRRTTFGAAKSDLDTLKALTMSSAVDLLLTVPATAPDPPVNNYNDRYADPTVAAGQTWVNAVHGDGTVNSLRIASFKSWWYGLMINQSLSIVEKMTLFWHNHFSTETGIVSDARYVYKYNSLLRQNALGNFKDLTTKITTDPAMLVYLNGRYNTKTAPDENYGRELQELFTSGKGPNSQYTEADVKAAAHVLTGWKDDPTNIASTFDSTRHDPTDKQFSAYYNNTVITGRTGSTAGQLELNDLMSMIFAQPEVSKFICRKLYRWFVYYVIDQNAEDNVITPLAQMFRDTNYDIKQVLSVLLKSAHFYDSANVGCVIKNPIDFTAGFIRQFSLPFPDSSAYVAQYTLWGAVQNLAAAMELNLGDPPNVAGWPAYYQIPEYYELWINSDSLPKRKSYTDMLNTNGYQTTVNGTKYKIVIDPIAFANQFSTPGDPNQLIADMAQFLLPIQLSDNEKTTMKNALLSGQASDYYWTNAWNDYIATPTDVNKKNIVFTRLQSVLSYMLDISEFQLA
ncbi:MAG: DUF1800 domain-containing protein [Bacteroidota bacterium]|nr:DUF1800 domain-containing protein [Bacteroidota bacterium]